jgi:uncharacterized protein (DUF1778 family)
MSSTTQQMGARRAGKRESLNIRIKSEERGMIDRAAEMTGKNRTDFILDACRRAAEEAILDRTVFVVSPEAYAEFLTRLEAPPEPNERLRRTLAAPMPWE